MMRFVLIRPGSTEFDEQGRIQGRLDIPLTSCGAADAARVAEELRDQGLTALYSCPCQSAWQTATAIGKVLSIKPKQIDKLQNVDQGLWQGMLIDEVKHKQPKVYRQWQDHPENICPPEGEMLSQVEDRIQAAFSKLLRKHKDGTVGLVLPEPLASIVYCCLTHSVAGDLWKGCDACGTWEVVQIDTQALAYRGLVVKPAQHDALVALPAAVLPVSVHR
jgi:broad specificity phosphatase PhoE